MDAVSVDLIRMAAGLEPDTQRQACLYGSFLDRAAVASKRELTLCTTELVLSRVTMMPWTNSFPERSERLKKKYGGWCTQNENST